MKEYYYEKGHTVNVTNWGEMYTQYSSFFNNKAIIPTSVIARYAFNDNSNTLKCKYSDSKVYEVLYVDWAERIAVITFHEGINSPVYLVGLAGLKPCPKRMTKEEIEQELGYPIEIV